jgi:hypothetical protein
MSYLHFSEGGKQSVRKYLNKDLCEKTIKDYRFQKSIPNKIFRSIRIVGNIRKSKFFYSNLNSSFPNSVALMVGFVGAVIYTVRYFPGFCCT